jgi:uncharacterized DUF497 family protein
VHFTWDPRKAVANVRKHGVGFREAATVVEDALSATLPDQQHSINEQRFVTIGVLSRGRLLVVAHTEPENTSRVISARPATRQEPTFYEGG